MGGSSGAMSTNVMLGAYPGYTGPRPRMQIWHGDQDNTLSTPNFFEEIDQWTDVLGCPRAASDSQANVPKANWTRTLYKDKNGQVQVEAYLAGGVGHGVPMYPDSTLRFFGLDTPAGTALERAPGSVSLDILSATGSRLTTLAGHPGREAGIRAGRSAPRG